METLIIQLKNKNEAKKVKGILGVLKTKFQILEDIEDVAFGKMIEDTKKSARLSNQEKENLLNSILG